MAPNVHTPHSGESPTLSQEPLRSMNREFQIRFTAGLLVLLTTAAVVLAWINFQKERDFQIPSDGVWWVEQAGNEGGLVAERVEPNGPGDKAGIRVGDRLTAINEREVKDTAGRMRQAYRVGAWSKATYSVIRQSVPVDMSVILIPAERSLNYWLRFIALIYLGIGLYVLLRRWTAPSSTHFYIFLPGFVHFLRLQVQRKAERLRLDDLLGQCGGVAVAACPVSAFCSDVSRDGATLSASIAGWFRRSMCPGCCCWAFTFSRCGF